MRTQKYVLYALNTANFGKLQGIIFMGKDALYAEAHME